MQKITVKEIKGPLGKGEKKFYAVVDPKGGEFTTFDAGISSVTPGSVIEAEIKVDGRYVNITEWKVLEAAPAGAGPAPGNGQYKRDTEGIRFEYELKAYIESVKHVSIEAQTAFNGIVKLAEVATISDKIDALVATLSPDLWQKALLWAESRLDTSMALKSPPEAPKGPKAAPAKARPSVNTKGAPGPQDPAPSEGDAPQGFGNVGQLLTWAHKEYGLDRAKVMEICGVNEQTLSKLNLLDAHIAIQDYIEVFGPEGVLPE